MINLLLFVSAPVRNTPFGSEAMKVFFEGLKVLAIGMTTVIGVLFFFFLLIKLLVKLLPNKE